MIKMLIIADDYTGALDTGVKFSATGAATKVVTDTDIDFSAHESEEVLVFCAPTRHLPAEEAYRQIRRITERAVAANIGCIFKKTDSALRGNIGAELSAVLDGSGERALSFIPALPDMDRITTGGTHYINGAPVSESVFGQDPFGPVTESYVPALLHQQCDTAVRVVPCGAAPDFEAEEAPCIYVFDCVTKADMEQEVQMLHQSGKLGVLAGCAGLAESLAPYLGLTKAEQPPAQKAQNRLTVVCGSMNPISTEQMDYAQEHGFRRIHLPVSQLLDERFSGSGVDETAMEHLWDAYCRSEYLIIDTLPDSTEQIAADTSHLPLEKIRQRVSRGIGTVLKALIDRGADSRFVIIGGDTLLAFMESIRCSELSPVCEILPGVVLSRVSYGGRRYEIYSKSGGFGEQDLLVRLRETCAAAEYPHVYTAPALP